MSDESNIRTEYELKEIKRGLELANETIRAQNDVIKDQAKIIQDRETIITVHENRITQLEENYKNLKGGINRGLWILGGGFISAFVMWITNGGMNGG